MRIKKSSAVYHQLVSVTIEKQPETLNNLNAPTNSNPPPASHSSSQIGQMAFTISQKQMPQISSINLIDLEEPSSEMDDLTNSNSNCQKSQNPRSHHRRKHQDCPTDQQQNSSSHLLQDHVGSKQKLMMTISAEDKSQWDSLMRWTVFTLLFAAITPMIRADDRVGLVTNNWERPAGMPNIKHLEVMCGNQHMEVHLAFDKPFHGLVGSKGMSGHDDCMYVPPRTGKNSMVFNIYYDKCGTKPDNHGKFYENTIVVQYDEELIEAWDEAKRLRCEWFNDYEKTATKTSPMVISDLEVVELNFHGDNVDCWMEVQEGKGPWAPPLSGIAPLGSTLTMVIAVKDPSGEFDMRVKDCEASDGHTGRSLALSDPEGCIVRPKLLGKFSKVKLDDGRATVLTYAFISAFKFPDMLNVHLRCTVEICRHGCPEHCTGNQGGGGNLLGQYSENEPVGSHSQNTFSKVSTPDQKDQQNSLDENPSSISKDKPDINQEAMQNQNHNHHQHSNNNNNNNKQTIQLVQEIPRYPANQQHVRPPLPPNIQGIPIPDPLHSGEGFASDAPPQMRPPPPPSPQYGGRPQRAPRPPLPLLQHKQFPPGLLRQRPDLLRFPPSPPGPLPQRFTGTIKHTIGDNGPPEKQFMEEQQRHHSQRMQNMQLKPEPKNSAEGISERSGEPGPENNNLQKDSTPDSGANDETNEEKDSTSAGVVEAENKNDAKDNKNSKEKMETEMLMEAQALKDESGGVSSSNDKESAEPPTPTAPVSPEPKDFPKGPRHLRIRRSISGSSDVIGVQGAFRVVSQADLNFVMNSNVSSSTPTIVLRGKMTQGDPIYGICLPRMGFGVVFFGLGLAALVAILIAAFLAYAHYTVAHYKGNGQGESAQGIGPPHSMPMPMPYQFLPMVILRKMW